MANRWDFMPARGKNRVGACHTMPILQPDSPLKNPLRLLALLPALFCCGLIFYLSSLPGNDIDLPFQVKDKVLHFGAFGVLTACWIWGLRMAFQVSWKKAIIIGVIIGILYGASDELHQGFTPGRSQEIADWVADALGAIAAGLFFLPFQGRST